MEFIRKYDDDEVMIFSGRVADKVAAIFFEAMRLEFFEVVRNAMVDNVEAVMRGYAGDAEVPLPDDLKELMRIAGFDAGVIALRDKLTPNETFGLTN